MDEILGGAAQALVEMTILGIDHGAVSREIGQNHDGIVQDAELSGLCIVTGGRERGVLNQLSGIQLFVVPFGPWPTHVTCHQIILSCRCHRANVYSFYSTTLLWRTLKKNIGLRYNSLPGLLLNDGLNVKEVYNSHSLCKIHKRALLHNFDCMNLLSDVTTTVRV